MSWQELSIELQKPLSKDNVKQRQGMSYVEGWYVIDEANQVFGFDGWQQITSVPREVQSEKDEKNQCRVAYTCQVTIEVNGVRRDGTGFGQGIDRDLGKAHESAIKEAETDAMKRAFRTFGYRFGLALYDKSQEHVEGSSSQSSRQEPRVAVTQGDYELPLKAEGLKRAQKKAEDTNVDWAEFLQKCADAKASTVAQCDGILKGMSA